MDTRPGHAQVTEPQSLCDRSVVVEPDAGCPRQRFFVEARKRDDGDAVRIAEER
jgi:hypothetical protein